jgi:uncharacterized protein
MFKNIKNGTVAVLLAGVLLWLGLSPRVASRLYEAVLMPRARPEGNFGVGSAVTLKSQGIELEGLMFINPDASKIVLYCGGRSSNLMKLSIPALALYNAGVSVVIVEPRGFGNTAGRATMKTLVEDYLYAYDSLLKLGYAADNIVIYGESLGGAIAVYVSARRPASGLILQSTFSSLDREISDLIPLLRYPAALYPQPRLEADESLKRGHPPLLIIHGDNDTVINVNHALRLAAAAGENTTLAILPRAGHFLVHGRDDWFQAVTTFLGSL